MYACKDKNKIIAFHDDEDVVNKYSEQIYSIYGINLITIKVKKSYKEMLIKYHPEMEIIKQEFIYIRVCDKEYYDIIGADEFYTKIKYIEQFLYSIIKDNHTLTKKQISSLSKTITILDDIAYDGKSTPPSPLDVDEYFEIKNLYKYSVDCD